jgi:hypothetical protein
LFIPDLQINISNENRIEIDNLVSKQKYSNEQIAELICDMKQISKELLSAFDDDVIEEKAKPIIEAIPVQDRTPALIEQAKQHAQKELKEETETKELKTDFETKEIKVKTTLKKAPKKKKRIIKKKKV